MVKKHALSLFIFRRDLRCDDNIALLQACNDSEQVIPCFIFDPRQVGDNNSYKSNNCIEFMIESLHDLAASIEKKGGTLFTFYGPAHEIVEQLLEKLPLDAVYCNKDYTPFSNKRDELLQKVCKKHKKHFYCLSDLLLCEPETFLNKQGKPYLVFTPFFKAAQQQDVMQPVTCTFKNFYMHAIKEISLVNLADELTSKGVICTYFNKKRTIKGGRTHSTTILKNIQSYKNYIKTHDIPALPTTHLSAYLKFGTHSVREVWHTIVNVLGYGHPLVRQLYWRDFFTHIAFHFPHVFGHAFHQNYDHLVWANSKKDFKRWREGKTGFPLIDAGMRELNTTGFMHNRVRMVVASFLVKDLRIDWRWGEQYFAQQLVDYDPAVNNGNWQWSAGTGCDAQPYFRIFNPWLQQKKFDPACEYIKTWVPELQQYDAKAIHAHEKKLLVGYEAPMLDHTIERKKTVAMFKLVK